MFIRQTKLQFKEYLTKINKLSFEIEYSLIAVNKWISIKEKAIYNELNKLKDGDKILTGLFWCPARLRSTLEEKIREIR